VDSSPPWMGDTYVIYIHPYVVSTFSYARSRAFGAERIDRRRIRVQDTPARAASGADGKTRCGCLEGMRPGPSDAVPTAVPPAPAPAPAPATTSSRRRPPLLPRPTGDLWRGGGDRAGRRPAIRRSVHAAAAREAMGDGYWRAPLTSTRSGRIGHLTAPESAAGGRDGCGRARFRRAMGRRSGRGGESSAERPAAMAAARRIDRAPIRRRATAARRRTPRTPRTLRPFRSPPHPRRSGRRSPRSARCRMHAPPSGAAAG